MYGVQKRGYLLHIVSMRSIVYYNQKFNKFQRYYESFFHKRIAMLLFIRYNKYDVVSTRRTTILCNMTIGTAYHAICAKF